MQKKTLGSILAVGAAGAMIAGGALLSGGGSTPAGQIGDATSTEAAPTYYAQVDKNGTVQKVIVASPDFIASGAEGDPSQWVQTSPDDPNGYAGKGLKYTGGKFRSAADLQTDRRGVPMTDAQQIASTSKRL